MIYDILPLSFVAHNFVVKSLIAFLCAFAVSILLGKFYIRWSAQKNGLLNQPIRSVGPQDHLVSKKNIPTMGGVFLIISALIATVVFGDLSNNYLLLALFSLISYGMIGFLDDYVKVMKKSNDGIGGKLKLFLQIILAVIIIKWHYVIDVQNYVNYTIIPFKQLFGFNTALVDFSWFFGLFAIFVLVGSSNAVNLTDGLDGLVSLPVILSILCFVIILSCVPILADDVNGYSAVSFESREVIILCVALIGSIIGFLWFNCNPAQVFMGDTGSLALGSFVGTLSIVTHSEFLLVVIGGIFVIEAMSVIIQVGYFKLTKGKKILLMAPIHHHFEKKGFVENKIVLRMWIISTILSVIGMGLFFSHMVVY